MDIKQLIYFISIVEHHSFSDAAKSLFITQPTLSQTVKKLEQEFNTRLFIHDSTKKQLTTSGQLLYKEGKILIKQFEQLTQQMHQLQTTSNSPFESVFQHYLQWSLCLFFLTICFLTLV